VASGMLHLLYTCVSVIFWRVFMKISFSCPSHLTFGATLETWTGLIEMSRGSIEWLDMHEDLFDVWLLVAYAATSCAIVQVRYHGYQRLTRAALKCIHSITIGRDARTRNRRRIYASCVIV